MTDYTIANDYSLPSEGRIYENVNPIVKLRSMTTVEEMKRLNKSDRPYKVMAEIIDSCITEPIGISSYDLCIPDYQYLLHKLRIVTYGPQYRMSSTCPFCTTVNTSTVNLDDLPVIPFDQDTYNKYSQFLLPVTNKQIKLRMQTPRILDTITVRTKEAHKGSVSTSGDSAFLFTLESLIDTIDGERPEQFRLIEFLKQLPMKDTNYILKAGQKLNSFFGLESELLHVCGVCGLDYTSTFRTTSEFFGPSID